MMGGWGNMGGWGYGGYGGYGMMGIGMLVFWIGIIILGIYLFRRNSSHVHRGGQGKTSSMEILSERYARGEIDSEDYQRRKRDLEGK